MATLRRKLIWRRGRRPKERVEKIVREAPQVLFREFVVHVRRNAGRLGHWPKRTGNSADSFRVTGNTISGLDYAAIVNARYNNLLGTIWERYAKTSEFDRALEQEANQ